MDIIWSKKKKSAHWLDPEFKILSNAKFDITDGKLDKTLVILFEVLALKTLVESTQLC